MEENLNTTETTEATATELPSITVVPVKEPKRTKTSITIGVMNANAGLPMADVVKLIAIENNVSIGVANGAYRWCVRKGVAAGVIPEKAVKAAPVAVEPVVKAPKAAKAKTDSIKAVNLTRMKGALAKRGAKMKVDEAAAAPAADPVEVEAPVAEVVEAAAEVVEAAAEV